MNIANKVQAGAALTVAGKTILYTGAAGGLGTDTTLQFLRAGARVVAIDNDHTKVENLLRCAVVEGLKGLLLCEADLSDLADLRARLERKSAEVGGFDVVINNAAIYPSKAFEEYTIEEQYVVAQQNAADQFVFLYKSLGGGWENYQAIPPIRRPQPAAAAAVRSLIEHGPAP